MMKKIFKYMMMALAAIMITTGIASCSSDSEEDFLKDRETLVSAKLEFNMNLTQDLLDVADISVIYIDKDGKEITDKITSLQYQKDIVFPTIPSKITYTIKMSKKANAPAKDKYQLELIDTSVAATYNKLGERHGKIKADGYTLLTTVRGDKLDDFFANSKDFVFNFYPNEEK